MPTEMDTRFEHSPHKPKHDECGKAFEILSNAHNSASSLLKTFESVCEGKQARKPPTAEQQDLLRAMLIFASAGLDSMVKQLIRDALPKVIDTDTGATKNFKTWVERQLDKEKKGLDHAFLADILGDPQPRKRLLDLLVSDLISRSLQSTQEVFKVAAHFDIPTQDLNKKKNDLTAVFTARNQIAHEMDVDLEQQESRPRRLRDKQTMIDFTNEVFRLSDVFLGLVDAKLNGTPPRRASPAPRARRKRSAF